MKKKILMFFIAREAFRAGITLGNWATIHYEESSDEKWRDIMFRDYNRVNKIMDKVADFYIWVEDILSVVTDKIKK